MNDETYSADITKARDFRILKAGDDYVLQWQIMDGTIMVVTSIKTSAEGLAHTIGYIDATRHLLPQVAP